MQFICILCYIFCFNDFFSSFFSFHFIYLFIFTLFTIMKKVYFEGFAKKKFEVLKDTLPIPSTPPI